MKIYLASRFSNRFILRDLREQLIARGHEVTSRWVDSPKRPRELTEEWPEDAVRGIEDMNRADTLILYTHNCDGARGGMRFEEGYCYALKKPIFVLGPRIIVFDQLKDITYCQDADDLFEKLQMSV